MAPLDITSSDGTRTADDQPEFKPPRMFQESVQGVFNNGYACGRADGFAVGFIGGVIVATVLALMI